MQKDLRIGPRYPFSAIAEVTDSRGAEMRVQITEISACGCRFLSKGKLSVGTEVTIRIRTASDQFQASAIVVRSTRTGTGVMFKNVNTACVSLLAKWLAAARSAVATIT